MFQGVNFFLLFATFMLPRAAPERFDMSVALPVTIPTMLYIPLFPLGLCCSADPCQQCGHWYMKCLPGTRSRHMVHMF